MSLLSKLQTTTPVETQDRDSKGSGKFTLDSNVYPAVIKVAYLDQSAKGAIAVAFEFGVQVDGAEKTYKETVYISTVTGALEKVGNDGVKYPLPKYVMVNTLCKIASGTPLLSLATEVKAVKVWNKEQRAEVPTNKEVLTGLIGKQVILGLIEEEHMHWDQDKASQGVTQFKNRIDKVFNLQGQTESEIIANATPEFINYWIETNRGKLIDCKEQSTKATTVTTPSVQNSPFAQSTAQPATATTPDVQASPFAKNAVQPIFG